MGKWTRRIRGALGMGVAFGAAWFGAGMLIMLVFLLTTGSTGADVPYPLGFGALGFAAGVLFSLVLSLTEGRRHLEQLSLPRFAGWGAAGGLLLSVLFVSIVTLVDDPGFLSNLVVLGPVFGVAGATCAAGSLWLARKAGGRSLPHADAVPLLDQADSPRRAPASKLGP